MNDNWQHKAPEMNRQRQQAFTLVELLIALVLVGLILSAVVYVNIGTVRASASLQARNELLSETQLAQNYMAGKLKYAAYVYPSGSTITMTSSGYSTEKPTAGYTWTVGTDPIVAFVMPPKNGANLGICSATPSTTPSADRDDCYYFYAFYAIKRSQLTANANGVFNPGKDGLNDLNSWVIMEYRASYAGAGYGATTPPTTTPPPYPTGKQGRLLLDYLEPIASPDMLFTAPAAGAQTAGTTNVVISLAVRRNVGGQILNLPATDRYTLTAYPRNVGKPVLPN